MPSLSVKSIEKLNTCDPRIRVVIEEAIKIYDFTVLCGVRTKEEQEAALNGGFSKVNCPESKHNLKPGRNEKYSLAIDVAPWPISWDSTKEFYYLAGVIMAVAQQKGIKLRWGGNFNRDYNLSNDKFLDLPHIEIDE